MEKQAGPLWRQLSCVERFSAVCETCLSYAKPWAAAGRGTKGRSECPHEGESPEVDMSLMGISFRHNQSTRLRLHGTECSNVHSVV